MPLPEKKVKHSNEKLTARSITKPIHENINDIQITKLQQMKAGS